MEEQNQSELNFLDISLDELAKTKNNGRLTSTQTKGHQEYFDRVKFNNTIGNTNRDRELSRVIKTNLIDILVNRYYKKQALESNDENSIYLYIYYKAKDLVINDSLAELLKENLYQEEVYTRPNTFPNFSFLAFNIDEPNFEAVRNQHINSLRNWLDTYIKGQKIDEPIDLLIQIKGRLVDDSLSKSWSTLVLYIITDWVTYKNDVLDNPFHAISSLEANNSTDPTKIPLRKIWSKEEFINILTSSYGKAFYKNYSKQKDLLYRLKRKFYDSKEQEKIMNTSITPEFFEIDESNIESYLENNNLFGNIQVK